MGSLNYATPSPAPALWRLPLVLIGITHLVVPLAFLFGSEPAAQVPGGWIGPTLFMAQLVCLSYTAGTLALRLAFLRGAETALLALTIFACVPAGIVPYLGFAGHLSFTSLSLATGGLEIALLTLTRNYSAAVPPDPQDRFSGLGLWERFVVSLSLLAFGVMAFNAVRYTPRDSDSLWYHLPFVAEWIKTHSIAPIASVPLFAKAYPGAREAILTWLSFPMRSDNLALLSLGNL